MSLPTSREEFAISLTATLPRWHPPDGKPTEPSSNVKAAVVIGPDSSTSSQTTRTAKNVGRVTTQSRTFRKRKSFSVAEKLALIAELESGRKMVDVCREYGISSSTLSTFAKKKDVFIAAFQESRPRAKRLRKATREDLDRSLLRWYHQAKASGVAISGALLQAKAGILALQLGYEDSIVPNSWIERFKKRHSLSYSRERKVGVDKVPDVDSWLATSWPQIRSGYPAWDVFSAVETGLLFRVLPAEARRLRGILCEQGQMAQHRLTLYVCSNMTADEKRPLLAIGSCPLSKSPTMQTVRYSFNDRAWMSQDIFSDELQRWDNELNARRRKVLLLVDRRPCHLVSRKQGLRNIEIVYPPPNTGASLLPLDNGVVQDLKRGYRKLLLVHSVLQDTRVPLTLQTVLRLLGVAWKEVKDSSVRASFAACGLHADNAVDDVALEVSDDLPLEEWASRFDLGERIVDGIGEYESVDELLVTSGKLEATESSLCSTPAAPLEVEETSNSGDSQASAVQILDAVDVLLKFCETSRTTTGVEGVVDVLQTLRTKAQMLVLKSTRELKGD